MTNTDDIRAEWTARREEVQQRMRSAGGAPGVASREAVAGLSGMEVMQAMLAGRFPYPHIADTMDFSLVEIEHGKAVFQGTPQLKHYNPLGSVHGGGYATLLDSALGCAVRTTMPAGRGYTTAELGIHIVRGANERSGPMRAIGTVLHSGRQLATAEARIVGPDGKLYAHGSATCLVFDTPK